MEDDTDRADRVVVARDREIDLGRICVGIDDGDDGDAEAAGFGNGDGLASGVNDDDGVRFFSRLRTPRRLRRSFSRSRPRAASSFLDMDLNSGCFSMFSR